MSFSLLITWYLRGSEKHWGKKKISNGTSFLLTSSKYLSSKIYHLQTNWMVKSVFTNGLKFVAHLRSRSPQDSPTISRLTLDESSREERKMSEHRIIQWRALAWQSCQWRDARMNFKMILISLIIAIICLNSVPLYQIASIRQHFYPKRSLHSPYIIIQVVVQRRNILKKSIQAKFLFQSHLNLAAKISTLRWSKIKKRREEECISTRMIKNGMNPGFIRISLILALNKRRREWRA